MNKNVHRKKFQSLASKVKFCPKELTVLRFVDQGICRFLRNLLSFSEIVEVLESQPNYILTFTDSYVLLFYFYFDMISKNW